ncbi:hypothetical protein [Roseomonas elaeocarpi]|uniref:Uncharacterized protein n=1 Tax=Roseomonas elaeocarpi TaxID=907779 RepID=A0ABV6JQ79_9PROT
MADPRDISPSICVQFGPQGGPVWRYRGALIETGSTRNGAQNYLRLFRHPCDGLRFDDPSDIVNLVDWWIDGNQTDERALQILEIGRALQRRDF